MELHLLFQEAALASVLIIFLTLFLSQKMATTNSKKKHPPQPKGVFPIVGHLHLLRTSEPDHIILGNMAETCGPIFTIKLGVHKAIVVSDREIAKECFTTNDIVFASRPKSLVVELIGYNYAMFGLSPYGDYWRQMRKVVTVVLLSKRRVDMLRCIRVPEVRALIKNVYDAWVLNKESEGSDMLNVDIKELFMNLLLNIVTRTLFGKQFSTSNEEGIRLIGVVRKFFEAFDGVLVSDYLPYLKFLDLGGHQKQMKTSAKELDYILEGLLKEHRKERRDGQHDGKQDFMHSLISILEGDSKEEFVAFDHDTIIKATCLVILTGSLGTTQVILTCALSLLLNNPEAMKTAQKEIDVHVGKDRLVEESDITNLVYIQAIIKETMRLYPPSPIGPAHESIDDCVVAGYNIPKGTRLILNVWKIQHDPNVWTEPNQFRPERFLTSQKDVDFRGYHYEFLPFGSGRRMCAGLSFAVVALHLILASFIQSFELAKESKEPIDLSLKESPLEVLLTPRLSLDMYHAC